jgi:hypothetical protein
VSVSLDLEVILEKNCQRVENDEDHRASYCDRGSGRIPQMKCDDEPTENLKHGDQGA